MRKRREGVTGLTGLTGLTGVTESGVTKEGVTEYPAVIEALVDPVKRAKLEKIYHSSHNVEARYGLWGPTFDIIGELLEVTTGVWPK